MQNFKIINTEIVDNSQLANDGITRLTDISILVTFELDGQTYTVDFQQEDDYLTPYDMTEDFKKIVEAIGDKEETLDFLRKVAEEAGAEKKVKNWKEIIRDEMN